MDIRKFYFGNSGEFSNETVQRYVDMCSDIFFRYSIDRTVKYLSKRANVYYYRFSIEGGLNYFKNRENQSHFKGSQHGDELCYIFKCNVLRNTYANLTDESVERKTIQSMVKLWTNFAKYGSVVFVCLIYLLMFDQNYYILEIQLMIVWTLFGNQ